MVGETQQAGEMTPEQILKSVVVESDDMIFWGKQVKVSNANILTLENELRVQRAARDKYSELLEAARQAYDAEKKKG